MGTDPGIKASVSVSYTFKGGNFFTRRWKIPWLTLRTLLPSKVFGSRLHDIAGKLPHGEKQRAKLSRKGRGKWKDCGRCNLLAQKQSNRSRPETHP